MKRFALRSSFAILRSRCESYERQPLWRRYGKDDDSRRVHGSTSADEEALLCATFFRERKWQRIRLLSQSKNIFENKRFNTTNSLGIVKNPTVKAPSQAMMTFAASSIITSPIRRD